MRLSSEEKQAVEQGKPVEITDGTLHYVVIRADVFGRFKSVLDQGLPDSTVTELTDEAMSDCDEQDPLLASYQNDAS